MTEGDLDPAYISALSGLAGALIGGLTSFGTSWVTQRNQLRHTHGEAKRAKLEALYSEFIAEASRRYGDALSHQRGDIADMIMLFALIGRMRLVSSRPVIIAAEHVTETITETYLAPNRTLEEMLSHGKQGA